MAVSHLRRRNAKTRGYSQPIARRTQGFALNSQAARLVGRDSRDGALLSVQDKRRFPIWTNRRGLAFIGAILLRLRSGDCLRQTFLPSADRGARCNPLRRLRFNF
jgi:hypothetical protein